MEIKGAKEGSFIPGKSPDPGMEISSIAWMKLLIALGEGEIAGGFDGKDIYLDGTPLIGANGAENFANVRWEWRPGVQEQSYIQGFSSVENEIEVNADLKVENPWVKAINNAQLSAIRIRLKFPNGLFWMNDDGAKRGHKVEYAIDISTDGGAYAEYGRSGADGIANTGYEQSYRINLPKAVNGWQIRVRRLTPTETDGRHADAVQIASMTEIIDAKMKYPHTALLYVEFDAKVFEGRTPTVTVLAKGRIIRVPSNYNPETRDYLGVWDGTFKWAWTNNPAWVFYDLVTNPRFGLGNRLTQNQVDKWELYRIAQYCDQPVSDGKGGKEPRFLCDLCISSQADAWTVLMDLSSIFRGMISWSNNTLSVVADMPEDLDPDFIFHRGNVIDGSFNRAGTSERSHYSTGLITFSNPANQYQDDQAPVFVYPLVKRFGINSLEMTATGCTRETEAQRRGLWAIHTNVDDNGTEFKTGLEGQLPRVGKVIGVANNLFAGREIGGRISSAAGRTVTVDRDIKAKAGDRLIVNLPTGKAEGRTVSSVAGRVITVTAPYSTQPEADFGWAIDADDLAIQQYRVKRIADEGGNQFTISAIPYNPNKYARIDDGAVLDDRPVTIIPPHGQEMPSNIAITSSYSVDQGIGVTTMFVSWSPAAGAVAYEAQWRQNNGNWINVPRSGSCNFSVSGIYAGRYQVRVRAVSPSDLFSVWVNSAEVELLGKYGKPPMPINFVASPLLWGIGLSWAFPAGAEDTLKTEIQYSATSDGQNALLLSDVPFPQRSYSQMGLKAGQEFWYRARLVDRIGNQGDWIKWVRGQSNADGGDYLENIGDGFMSSEDGEQLTGQIDTNIDAILQNALANNATVDHQWSQYGEVRADILVVKTTIAEVDKALAEMTTQVQAQIGDVTAALEDKLTATVDADGATAVHTLKTGVRINGVYYSAGMSIAVLAQAGQPVVTRVGFNANQFVLMSGSGDNQYSPFAVVNGQVFISDAFIQDASITSAKIKHASIGGAQITDYLQSDNYSPGSVGMKLGFRDGYVEINGSVPGEGRNVINSDGVAVYDGVGRIRVKLGRIY